MKIKFGVILLNLFFLLLVSCTKTSPFPTELIGTWFTEEPLYEDRYIEINEAQLIFGTGAGEPNVLFIDKFEKKEQDGFVEWTLYCQNIEGDSLDIVLFYKRGADIEQIRLKNNKQIQWIKHQE